jgi:hypothetical protein
MQLIEQLDAELGIEKFRTELESSRVLVRLLCRGHGTAHASVQATSATCDVGTHVEFILFLFLMSKTSHSAPETAFLHTACEGAQSAGATKQQQ